MPHPISLSESLHSAIQKSRSILTSKASQTVFLHFEIPSEELLATAIEGHYGTTF